MKKKEIQRLLEKVKSPRKGLDAKKFSGVLKQRVDPLVYQRRMRDEWG